MYIVISFNFTIHFEMAKKVCAAGVDPGFFSGGDAPLRNDVTDR